MLRVYIAIRLIGLAGNPQVVSILNQETQMTECILPIECQQVKFGFAERTLLSLSAQQAKESTSLRTTLKCGAHFTISVHSVKESVSFRPR